MNLIERLMEYAKNMGQGSGYTLILTVDQFDGPIEGAVLHCARDWVLLEIHALNRGKFQSDRPTMAIAIDRIITAQIEW